MSPLHVLVAVAGEDYAVPVEQVVEVLEYGELTPVPGAAAAVLGVRNVRGQVLPVIDLAELLGLASGVSRGRIVVAEAGGRTAGLAVDAVAGVEALPQGADEVERDHLAGAVLAQGTLVGLVDVSSVFDAAQAGAEA